MPFFRDKEPAFDGGVRVPGTTKTNRKYEAVEEFPSLDLQTGEKLDVDLENWAVLGPGVEYDEAAEESSS